MSCAFPGCKRKLTRRVISEWCNPHLRQYRENKNGMRPVGMKSIADRFWYRVKKTNTCWLWLSGKRWKHVQ